MLEEIPPAEELDEKISFLNNPFETKASGGKMKTQDFPTPVPQRRQLDRKNMRQITPGGTMRVLDATNINRKPFFFRNRIEDLPKKRKLANLEEDKEE